MVELKYFQLKIPIDAEVQLVAQSIRRVPYHLRDKLTKKLKKLVIEKVVVVPKLKGDMRGYAAGQHGSETRTVSDTNH